MAAKRGSQGSQHTIRSCNVGVYVSRRLTACSGRDSFASGAIGGRLVATGLVNQRAVGDGAERQAMASSAFRQARRAMLVGALLALGPVAALATGKPSSKATITIKGGAVFKPNKYLQLNDAYFPGTITIASGGTITIKNTDTDGHSLSLVKSSDVPRTVAQVNNCGVCGPLFQAHGINPNGPPPTGPPPHPVVNVGAPGFDKPGDSTLVAPKGRPFSTVSFKVTAKRGSTLYFICIFHPWMQGKLLVK